MKREVKLSPAAAEGFDVTVATLKAIGGTLERGAPEVAGEYFLSGPDQIFWIAIRRGIATWVSPNAERLGEPGRSGELVTRNG